MGDYISRQALDECKELMTDINGETVYAVRMEVIRQAEDINEIIRRCEDIQNEDISDYHKDRAKVFAYNEIVKIWERR